MNLSSSSFQQLKAIAQSEQLSEYKSGLKTTDLPLQYATSMGQLRLFSELEDITLDGLENGDYDFDEICKAKKDLRCQVGKILSHLKAGNLPGEIPFFNNANATVLIIDKTNLDLTPDVNSKITIPSSRCMDSIILDKYEVPPGTSLCKTFFYAEEQIPNTNIFGTGVFVAQDKIMTAAHVMIEARNKKILPENILFIRKHLAYDITDSISVYKEQLFVLDQDIFYDNKFTIKGEGGDITWVYVKSLFDNEHSEYKYIHQSNGIFSGQLSAGIPVYGLGHGLGIPMKLSFKGYVERINTPESDYFNCDLNILPGNSGSPIFHAETHQLIGIVSGLHQISAKYNPNKGCAKFVIDMSGIKSGVITYASPLFNATIDI